MTQKIDIQYEWPAIGSGDNKEYFNAQCEHKGYRVDIIGIHFTQYYNDEYSHVKVWEFQLDSTNTEFEVHNEYGDFIDYDTNAYKAIVPEIEKQVIADLEWAENDYKKEAN